MLIGPPLRAEAIAIRPVIITAIKRRDCRRFEKNSRQLGHGLIGLDVARGCLDDRLLHHTAKAGVGRSEATTNLGGKTRMVQARLPNHSFRRPLAQFIDGLENARLLHRELSIGDALDRCSRQAA
ncbi:hypothetical protein D3C80_1836800 [compost metagenome]